MNRTKLDPLSKKTKSPEYSKVTTAHETQLVPLSYSLPKPITGDPILHQMLSREFGEEVLEASAKYLISNSLGPTTAASELQPSVSHNYVPVKYQSNHAYPLLVWLHGSEEGPQELLRLMPTISERNYLGMSLAPPVRKPANGNPGFASSTGRWSQDDGLVEATFLQFKSQLESMSRQLNVNFNRVFIAGADAGGTMAYRLAFEHPECFAGAASFNGALPNEGAPLKNLATSRQVPVFWVHGRDNTHLPESLLCQQLRLLHTAGFDVTLRQYPSDNRLLDPMLSDLNRWMMEMIGKQGANIVS